MLMNMEGRILIINENIECVSELKIVLGFMGKKVIVCDVTTWDSQVEDRGTIFCILISDKLNKEIIVNVAHQVLNWSLKVPIILYH